MPGLDPTWMDDAAATPDGRGWVFWVALVVILLGVAGGVSLLAFL